MKVISVRATSLATFWGLLYLTASCQQEVLGFLRPGATPAAFVPSVFIDSRAAHRKCPPLLAGVGIADSYSWKEDALELEITVPVPPDTRAKDVNFKAKQTSIDLRLKGEGDLMLLDGSRRMRGKISLDGTYWVISDREEDPSEREITVTIEKNMRAPKDDFDVVDYDWGGVYPDDEDEVVERTYEEPEELNVREYAASLGVDIDNINMSMVDKTMFSSGLNMTRSTLDQLTKAGYVQEVTQQGDGKQYVTDDEGEAVPFSHLGDDIGEDEIRDAAKIPFLDTSSPWHRTVPVDKLNVEADAVAPNATAVHREHKKSVASGTGETKVGVGDGDPIDKLTVKRLKEILRAQGLKVSGTKDELITRLRGHVRTMLNDTDEKDKIRGGQL